jgi:hypothetical protein
MSACVLADRVILKIMRRLNERDALLPDGSGDNLRRLCGAVLYCSSGAA